MFDYWLITILGSVLIFYLWMKSRKSKNFPPGPPRLPMVGSVTNLSSKSREKDGNVIKVNPLLNLMDKFGDFVGFYLGPNPTVIIRDYKTVKTLLNMNQTTGRPSFYPINELRPGWEALKGTENEDQIHGVGFTHGKLWKEQRRFLLKNMKDLGFGKTSMEGLILEEADKLITEICKSEGKPMRLTELLGIAVLNSLWVIVVGETLNFDDEKAMKVAALLHSLTKDVSAPQPPISYFLPSLSMSKWKILEPFTKRWIYEDVFNGMASLVTRTLKIHLKEHDPENTKDLMDLMIKEMNETTDPQSSFYGEEAIKVIINVMIDLFMAGMETTAASLSWTCLYMLHHPEMKRRVQDELDQVFGDNDPSLNLAPACHYTNAVLHESMRLTGFIPFSVPSLGLRGGED